MKLLKNMWKFYKIQNESNKQLEGIFEKVDKLSKKGEDYLFIPGVKYFYREHPENEAHQLTIYKLVKSKLFKDIVAVERCHLHGEDMDKIYGIALIWENENV